MLKRHLLSMDSDEVVCHFKDARLVTNCINDVTCRFCQATAIYQEAAEEARNPRDEAYERAAARYDGEGKDWR